MASNERDEALLRAIEEAGGPADLAQFITEHYEPITAQAICDWKRCPPLRVHQVEHAVRMKGGRTGARDLRPEMFPRDGALDLVA